MNTVSKPRGFAAMSPEKVREIASKGGKTAHALGVAHRWTREEASINGRKGGLAPKRQKEPAGTGPLPSTVSYHEVKEETESGMCDGSD